MVYQSSVQTAVVSRDDPNLSGAVDEIDALWNGISLPAISK